MMIKALGKIIFTIVMIMVLAANCFAASEPYENFIKGKLKVNDTLVIKDEKFRNPRFNWSEITNISVQNSIYLRVIDEQPISRDFSCRVLIKVEYFEQPNQSEPTLIDSLPLQVEYKKQKGAVFKNLDTYSFKNGYKVKLTVLEISSPEFGNQMPEVLQLGNNILIERKYAFKPFLYINIDGQTGSTSKAQRVSSPTGTAGNDYLALTWPAILGAEEFDLEWTTIDEDSEWSDLINTMLASGNPSNDQLDRMFRNNATRITTAEHNYQISLLFNARHIAVRIRQVQYTSDGLRVEGDWFYKKDNSNDYAVWDLSWHQQNLNWQYAASYAEEGKKKEVVSYFDGSLRGRQTVTLNNSDKVAVVQENIYDEFGRAAMSILPAPIKEENVTEPSLHYFPSLNKNLNGKPYSFLDLDTTLCEPLPGALNTISGTSRYYSPQNDFKNLKLYNNYIPDALGYPLSVTQYTNDNTGRIKIQGGVGRTFQPDISLNSHTTKYYYGKPEQWELDKLFGNDVGYAEHYLKNMVMDPNGQLSISYLNASGKTIATALAGPNPANVDSLIRNPRNSIDGIQLTQVLKPDQFIFDGTTLKLTASTTYMATVNGPGSLKYSIQQLINRYAKGTFQPYSNCYYDLTIQVKNDCDTPVYFNQTPIKIGSLVSNPAAAALYSDSIQVNFQKIGAYYITFEFALSKKVIEHYTDEYIRLGQLDGAVKRKEDFVLSHFRDASFMDCFSDCKTALAKLGSKLDFTLMFNEKLKSLGDTTSYYDNYISGLYDNLLSSATALNNSCDNIQPSPCDAYRTPMLADLSPGGQFALFDASGNPLESASNIIFTYFHNGAFNVLNANDPLRIATLVSKEDGSGSFSPYDADFTIADLINYWQPEWAEQFLQYHPEWCKLEFCGNNTSSVSWDQKIEEITAVAELPAKLNASYSRSNLAWLVDSDPFFNNGGAGSAHKSNFIANLTGYSQRVLGANNFSAKNISQFIDFQLYCADITATTNAGLSADKWANCSPVEDCRVEEREWQLYKGMYLDLKQTYFNKLRDSACSGSCAVGVPIKLLPVPQLPSDCVYDGPTANSNKNIALQKLSDVLHTQGSGAVEMWLYSTNFTSRQFMATTPDLKYMMQACFNGNRVSVDIFSLNQTSPENVSIVLSNHITADISDILPLKPWMHLAVQKLNPANGSLELWINGKKYEGITDASSAGCAWGITSNPLNMPENLGSIHHLRLYSGRNMSQQEIMTNAASLCFLASDHIAMDWYRFNAEGGNPETPTCVSLHFLNEAEQLSSTQFRETNYAANTRTTYTFIQGDANTPPNASQYCSNGTVQMIYRTCIDVMISATPIRLNGQWQITCTENLDGSCSGNSDGVLYVESGANNVFYRNTVGFFRDVHTVIEGYAQNNPPPEQCGSMNDGYQTFYNCLTVRFLDNPTVITYNNVWVNSCLGTYSGSSNRQSAQSVSNKNESVSIASDLYTAVRVNVDLSKTSPETALTKLKEAKQPGQTIFADYKTKYIYLVSNSVMPITLDVKGKAKTTNLFGTPELVSRFVVEASKGNYSILKNVYVAKYISEPGSIKAREEQTFAKFYGGKVATQRSATAQLRLTGAQGVISGAPAVCASLIDEDYGSEQITCMGNNYNNSLRQTTFVLTDHSGAPAVLAHDATVAVRYASIPGNNFGLPPASFLVYLTIPAGQSSMTYPYTSAAYADESLSYCVADQQNFECIESVTGVGFCNSYTNCEGVTINPENGGGTPLVCPEYLKTKVSHFPVAQSVDPTGLSIPDMIADAEELKQQQFVDAANGQADQWMRNLAPGLEGYSTDKIYLLRSKLIELSLLASDSLHIYGATTLPVGKSVVVGTSTYSTFGGVIKAVLGLDDFTNELNPWLISGPYPYDVTPQQTERTISNTNNELCTFLAGLNVNGLGEDDFYAQLKGQYGQSMTLSLADFKALMKGCTNCKFLLAKDLILPQFLIPGFKGCIDRADYASAMSSLSTDFGPNLSPSVSNYETIVVNYLNQKWGFALAYDDYKIFADGTDSRLCNLPPYTEAVQDQYACAKTIIELAQGNGTKEYLDYITQERSNFTESYLTTSASALAEVNVASRQKIFHYTLYYYDLVGNLVRTVPPEGVNFLTDNEIKEVSKVRSAGNVSCNYSGPTVASDENVALQKLSSVLQSAINNALELWMYSDFSGSRQFIAATPDLKYMVQACQNGKYLNVEIYSLSQGAAGNIIINKSNQVTAEVSNILPMAPWTHVVVQGADLANGNLQIFVNGKSYTPVSGKPVAGCAWAIDAKPLVMPRNFTAVKHFRLYENRLMSAAEIKANAENTCFMVSDTTALSWFRYNLPQEGGPTTIGYNSTQESQYAGIYPEHLLTTTYAYNATNQVIQQNTPDGGTSKFWYDYLSRLVVSQNAKQELAKDYSYTQYDILGRISEVGKKNTGTNVLVDPGYLATSDITTFQQSGTNTELTQTIYDEAPLANGGIPTGLIQNNLRKRVAASIYRETPASTAINASYYNYDMAGNVKKLYQQVNGLGLKTLDYEYDLVSGKVNLLAYQHDKPDAFYYQYKYDAENRLIEAWSSTQATIVSYGFGSSLSDPSRKLDASYQYYLHGPLARMELGPNLALVQGMDYAYTLQGWLKGVNGTHLGGQGSDMGQDGAVVAKDALGYSLGYYAGDYQPIGGSSANAFVSSYQQALGDITGQNLYNGNIGNSTYAIGQINNGSSVGYTYKYDQLNRLKALRQHGLSGAGTWSTSTISDHYKEDFSYDGNGNILALLRNGLGGQAMDQLNYRYSRDKAGRLLNNKLGGLSDAVDSGQQGELAGNTSYSYDAIGNLIRDTKEGITGIDWSVYGKIKQINKSAGNISYSYDPSGNRVSKLFNNKSTWYVRDAQGNSLAVYDNEGGHTNWKEQQLYGSSRLGMWKPELNLDSISTNLPGLTGNKNYELTNHLGNVMAVITDSRTQAGSEYEADVINAQDYYAFGSQMPGRIFNLGGYRYGFNGKENDAEVKGGGNQQDYGMRIYDPRIAKFLSVDPLQKDYAELTPYQFASNTPIESTDLDGLERKSSNENTYKNSLGLIALGTTTESASKEFARQALLRAAAKETTAKIAQESSKRLFQFTRTGVSGALMFVTLMLSPQSTGEGSDMSKRNAALNEFERLTNDPTKLSDSDVKRVLDRINRSQATPQDLIYRRSILQDRYPNSLGIGQKLDKEPNSAILSQNLLAEGYNREPNMAAHHIVAGNDPRAAEARGILKREGIDINEAVNGVFLPSNVKNEKAPAVTHSTVHTDKYYREINKRLSEARPGKVANELKEIGKELKNGTFPK